MLSPEHRAPFESMRTGFKRYVEQRLIGLPLKPNPDVPDIEETDRIPVTHTEVASVQFYKISLGIELPDGESIADHIGIRLNHHPRTTQESEEPAHVVTTDLDLSDPASVYDGTTTNIRKLDDALVDTFENTGGSYELVFSVLDSLHRQYPNQFPDINAIYSSH